MAEVPSYMPRVMFTMGSTTKGSCMERANTSPKMEQNMKGKFSYQLCYAHAYSSC